MSSRERGSALLIVFLFAAIVAIMLYMEMPVAAFEAQRQKEQLLIDRGNEYSHAVKLFVRKMGTYPTSIDQLEDTNRMRFLRHRFKDPFTGKDDWRLLHAGPGGMLIDSKVNPINQNNQNGSGTAGSSNSTFGSTPSNFASSSFGNNSSSTFGSSSDSSSSQVQVAPIPQRAPAIAANGASAAGEAQSVAADPNSISPLPAPTAQTPPVQGQPGVQNNPGAAAVTDPANTTPMLRNLLQNPNAPLPQTPGNSPNSPQMGTISNGGIAGVASKAEGHSIKTVKDQIDYSLWEFYYDPTKDALRGMPGNAIPGSVPAGAAPAANTNTGAFGSNSFTLNSPFSQPQPAPATTPPPTPPNQPPVVPPPTPPPE